MRISTVKFRQKYGLSIPLLMMGAITIFGILVTIFGPTFSIVQKQHAESSHVNVPHNPIDSLRVQEEFAIDDEVDSAEDLSHEELFGITLKSCLPAQNKACKEYMPESEDPVQRIGIIAPPGNLSFSLLDRLERIKEHHNHRENKRDPEIELIRTTHVPPYGYGKTHGWTRIVRLIPEPVYLDVTAAFRALLKPQESIDSITLNDVKAGLRQILRFHCRLSHVAAHTALLSVETNGLFIYAGETTVEAHKFMAPHDAPAEELHDDAQPIKVDDDHAALLDVEGNFASELLSNLQKKMKVDVLKILDEVLLEELKATNNMSAWPCLSFWAAGEPSDPFNMGELPNRLARELSPNCNDPLVKCWVQRDKCEFAGDGRCPEADRKGDEKK